MSARERLARAQEALVRALGTGAPVPEGFDAERVRVAARALVDKRRRWVERKWPTLVSALGADFASRFESWAREHPMTVEPNALADGRRFAESLREAGQLPAALKGPLQDFDLRWRVTGDGELVPRRGLTLSVAQAGTPFGFRFAVKLPGGRLLAW
ncbi:hypothetical protein HPC49_51800 [Pyxidicoccus fallax]|uniref:SCO6045-like C-terminal domain-containing protein n=1 Tax=Pyxidicoccus fallax TaxID=394095 RepID=A0A848LRZ3_9BACT|nr:hypothetical protein [Pyxidicoccus fallax]NMO20705.1 hypothetical protein [Pyxidicoccus fallax]NPC86658.1 hypothetical protein [Pyxidicoccus fallax]